MLLGCDAATPVMATALDAPPRRTVRVPPTPSGAVHATDVGTVVSSVRPVVVQAAIVVPRSAPIFTARKTVVSVAVITTAFLTAAMVATFELALAAPIAGAAQVPPRSRLLPM